MSVSGICLRDGLLMLALAEHLRQASRGRGHKRFQCRGRLSPLQVGVLPRRRRRGLLKRGEADKITSAQGRCEKALQGTDRSFEIIVHRGHLRSAALCVKALTLLLFRCLSTQKSRLGALGLPSRSRLSPHLGSLRTRCFALFLRIT